MAMAPSFDLLTRRKSKFVLWTPGGVQISPPPELILTIFDHDRPTSPTEIFRGPLQPSGLDSLWELDPNTIHPTLRSDQVYHYWFVITDTSPANLGRMTVTDPLAHTVDYRTVANRKPEDGSQPAGVVRFRDRQLITCDINGDEPIPASSRDRDMLPDNNHMVIYELPTSWTKAVVVGGVETDRGTFKDVLALFDASEAGDRFRDVPVIANEAVVADLGVNALELLPAADAKPVGEWGYATAHYYAPDFDLGTMTTSTDLIRLVDYVHSRGIRYFQDVVMAFGHDPYVNIAYRQFHIDARAEPDNPDSYQSHGQGLREGWGGTSWRYLQDTTTYDPESGATRVMHPSWVFHLGHLYRWMLDFGLDGYRLDSVNNVANYDFIRAYKDHAWSMYRTRYNSSSGTPPDTKFLVVGEELSVPVDMVEGANRPLDALWNETFKRRIRQVILGREALGDNFEWSVRKMIDCRLDVNHPFTDLAQTIIYLTSHDVGDFGNERLYNYLANNNITDTGEMSRRAKLANVCLLTAVGIPMIFSGEEFLDEQDTFRDQDQKQVDPVNYNRLSDLWRRNLRDYIANLVRFRQQCPALGGKDTDFIHVNWERKIMAWKRGYSEHEPVVVVANFSDTDTPGKEYVVPHWPDQQKSGWREVTENRSVPLDWIGREKLYRWSAKVYTRWTQ